MISCFIKPQTNMKYEYQTLAFNLEKFAFTDLKEFDEQLRSLFGDSGWETVGMANAEGKLFYTFRRFEKVKAVV
jgi:hypothetical protein